MPHYADGSPAHVGDIVRGKGYNIGTEIVGVAVAVNPDTEACNITVLLPNEDVRYFTISGNKQPPHTRYAIGGVVEYGQTDHFTKVGADGR